MTTLTLDEELERHLEALGARDEASKRRLAREALLEALLDLEDAREAEKRFATAEKSWALEELERGDDLVR